MVSIEINLIGEVFFLKNEFLLIFGVIASFLGSVYYTPEAWGLMGLVVNKYSPKSKNE